MSELAVQCLKEEVGNLRSELDELRKKCETCPFVLANNKNAETTKQIVIICLGIVGAVVGFKVLP